MEISQLSSQTTSCHPPLLSLKVIAALLDLVVSLSLCLFVLLDDNHFTARRKEDRVSPLSEIKWLNDLLSVEDESK